MLKTVTLILIFSAFLFSGCTIINPAETVPTYVRIDSIPYAQDSGRARVHAEVNSAWVYFNGTAIGVFDLPVTVPVLAKGPGHITIAPGITVLGLNSFLVKYPFYTDDTFTLVPQPGKVVTRKATTHYYPVTRFNVLSNFDFGATNFTLAAGTVNIGLTIADSDRYQGSASGLIRLKAPADTLSESSSSYLFSITINKDVYIEVDYNCDVPIYFGMQSNYSGNSFRTYLAGLYPTNGKWKKLYMPLRDFVAQYTGDSYQLYVKASLPDGQATGKVLLDNIQLVYSY